MEKSFNSDYNNAVDIVKKIRYSVSTLLLLTYYYKH